MVEGVVLLYRLPGRVLLDFPENTWLKSGTLKVELNDSHSAFWTTFADLSEANSV